jgi:glycosyltransferase involved in cell wall biosynthesis
VAADVRPAVSVVVPTHNRRDLLEEALGTVVGQRGVDAEIIVVDDGSSDDTSTFVASMADGRLKAIRLESTLGVSAARNIGLEAATRPWVAFIDDDDLWAPDKLVTQIEAMQSDPGTCWSCSAAVVVDHRLRPIGFQPSLPRRDLGDVLLSRNVIPGGASGVVLDTALARRVGGFDERLSVLADWDFWIRLGLASPIAAVARPLHAYRVHRAAMSNRGGIRSELVVVDEKHAAERVTRDVTLDRSAFEVWIGDRQQRAGRRLPAADSYLHSVPCISRATAIRKAAEVLVWPGSYRVRDIINGRRRGLRSVRPELSHWLPRPVSRAAARRGGGTG